MIPDCFQKPQRPSTRYIGCVLGLIERDSDMRLRSEIVDFIRLHHFDDVPQTRSIRNIPGMEKQPRAGIMRIDI